MKTKLQVGDTVQLSSGEKGVITGFYNQNKLDHVNFISYSIHLACVKTPKCSILCDEKSLARVKKGVS